MRISSWNINGLRASLKTGDFMKWLSETEPDIVGLQEVKATPDQLGFDMPWRELGYKDWWKPAEKAGYSGALLLSKIEPLDVRLGIGDPEFDAEGRVIEADFPDFTFLTAYFPNSGRGEHRVDYKVRFNTTFLARVDEIRGSGRNVIFVGDLNAAHTEDDLARPDENRGVAGFLPVERAFVDEVIRHGYIDTFRAFHPGEREVYTYWDAWRERRARNVGWRIDYVFTNAGFLPEVSEAFVQGAYLGSDHCPVGVDLAIRGAGDPGEAAI